MIPSELSIGDVYFSPLLPAIAVSLVATWITITVLNKLRLSRYIVFPSSTFLAIMACYILLIDAWWIKI
jgi:hypothetical protein